jgi:hypothetical protein
MRASGGIRRPRPVTPTSVPGEGPRFAAEAAVSAGRGDIDRQDYRNADKERVSREREISEEPNSSSFLGLSHPELLPHNEVIDAINRGTIAKMLLALIGVLLIATTLALIAATFVGVPVDALASYTKWMMSALIPLFTMALGYYFGSARQHRRNKR